jgi:hypothetical protein
LKWSLWDSLPRNLCACSSPAMHKNIQSITLHRLRDNWQLAALATGGRQRFVWHRGVVSDSSANSFK